MAEMEEEMYDEEDETITLVDDNGEEVEFSMLATVEYNNNGYVVLEPIDEIEGFNEDEVLILKIGEEDDESTELLPVEDEAELQAVFEEFNRLCTEEACGEDGCKDCGCTHCNC